MESLTRRHLLALGAAAAIAPRLRSGRQSVRTDDNPFALGVCAGDPDDHSAVLWTRLAQPDGSPLEADEITVTWELADDESFASIIGAGDVVAAAPEAHSVHVVVDVAGPSFFRFRAGDWTSPTGRVAPTGGNPAQLRLATATCQHFETGFYAAHRDLVEWAPDLVVFLGDFIYEYGGQNLGGAIVRSHGNGETFTIEEYRQRYALYLSDAHLQAARAACPWLAIWDDHEVENNYAGATSEDAAPADEFVARRLAAYQAWWEHMPVRISRPTGADDTIIYRTVPWGSLADVMLLDGRQFRSDQTCGDVVLSVDPACPETADPTRTMLGSVQEQWLGDQLAATTATWPVIAQQTVLSNVTLPNGAVLNFDQWDGYPAARQRLLLQAAQTERTVDAHGRHPPRRRRCAPRRRGRVRDVIDLLDRTGPRRPRRGSRRISRRRRCRTRPSRLHPSHDHPRDVDRRVPHRRRRCRRRSRAVSTWKTFVVDADVRDVVA